ncbi:EamA family transporter [Microbacterium sp. NPDC056736]|uniref:DMT family transporter n=1 Tax=Microbacterium sp. NPDC056736 TaxID=3345932 RepID=UPI00366C6B9F
MRLVALRNVGVQAALASAVLFGASTPLAKILLGDVSPFMLAGLLYLGSGAGLGLYRLARRAPRVRIHRREWLPLAGAIASGGIVAPVLLLVGLSAMPASGASLLLNLEGVFTAVLAWVVFRENVDRRVLLGMIAIVAGAVVLSWDGSASFADVWPSLAVIAACLAWGLDNNLTRKVALNDATWLAAAKGMVAGPVNLALAFALGASLPAMGVVFGAMAVGVISYGISLVLFIVALRHLGTARAGAYFSIAPFVGAAIALGFGAPLTWQLGAAALLMGIGVWLHLTERHDHIHTHEPIEHSHWHTHEDGHHEHAHEPPVPVGTSHRHAHVHEAVTHSHPHYPDAHHQHH